MIIVRTDFNTDVIFDVETNKSYLRLVNPLIHIIVLSNHNIDVQFNDNNKDSMIIKMPNIADCLKTRVLAHRCNLHDLMIHTCAGCTVKTATAPDGKRFICIVRTLVIVT